jgi:hypothetical protein
MLDGPEKSAFLRLSGDHGCSGIAPAEQGLPGIDPQSTALSLGSVAILAIGDQEGADARLEKIARDICGVGVEKVKRPYQEPRGDQTLPISLEDPNGAQTGARVAGHE